MSEFIQKYNTNGLYICLLLLVYNIWRSNSEYIMVILHTISLFNWTSCIIIINIAGMYLFLKNVSFEVNITCSVKYK